MCGKRRIRSETNPEVNFSKFVLVFHRVFGGGGGGGGECFTCGFWAGISGPNH